MNDATIRWHGVPLPDFIRDLPEIETGTDGVRGWIVQGEGRQVVFFELRAGTAVPPHSHAAQWGMVIEGVMDLTIGGETRTLRKGDSYVVPEGVVHAASFPTTVYAVDFFASGDRYKAKKRP